MNQSTYMSDSPVIGVCAYTLIFLSILFLTVEKKEEEIYKGMKFACSVLTGGISSEISGGLRAVLGGSWTPVAVGLRIPARGCGGAGGLRALELAAESAHNVSQRETLECASAVHCTAEQVRPLTHNVSQRVTSCREMSYTERLSSSKKLSHTVSRRETLTVARSAH